MAKKKEWFPVDVMLPDNARPVLAFSNDGYFYVAMYHPHWRKWYLSNDAVISGIDYWKELPEEPQ